MKRFISRYALVAIISLALMLSNQGSVQAQFDYMPSSSQYSASNFQEPADFVAAIVNTFMGIAISVSMIGLVFSGIKIIWSKGDPKEFEVGKQYLNYSLRGLFFSLGAVAIELIIRNILGASGPDVGIGL